MRTWTHQPPDLLDFNENLEFAMDMLVRRGDIFIMVIVMSLDQPQDSERLLDIERRLAALALRSL